VTDDTDPTVNHGQENRPGGREEQNHGAVKNGLSGPQDSPRLHQALSRSEVSQKINLLRLDALATWATIPADCG